MTTLLSSKAVYRLQISTKTWSRQAFRVKDCASTWALPPGIQQASEHSLVVQVQEGLSDRLHLLPEGILLYDRLQEIKSFDAAVSEVGKVTLAVVTTTGSLPNEFYSVVHGVAVPLSNHGKGIAAMDIATAEPFYAAAQDGTELDGILVLPKDSATSKPWPTVILVHGGPYQRVSCGFDLPFFNMPAWFASSRYAVLCVNYRGGSSHGNDYSTNIRGAAGTLEYSDSIDLVKAGVARGIIDANRVGICGWSYGGYITYLAVTQDSEFHFQAAIAGAGIVDWDLLTMTSLDDPEMAGCAPWDGAWSTANNVGDPIRHAQSIEAPLLMVHCENDDSVPVSHAKALHRGCLEMGKECELVIYPREGHGMFPPFQSAHYIDCLERTRRF